MMEILRHTCGWQWGERGSSLDFCSRTLVYVSLIVVALRFRAELGENSPFYSLRDCSDETGDMRRWTLTKEIE